MKTNEETRTCCFCGCTLDKYHMNNPYPIFDYEEDEDKQPYCCNKCNSRFVIPVRMHCGYDHIAFRQSEIDIDRIVSIYKVFDTVTAPEAQRERFSIFYNDYQGIAFAEDSPSRTTIQKHMKDGIMYVGDIIGREDIDINDILEMIYERIESAHLHAIEYMEQMEEGDR